MPAITPLLLLPGLICDETIFAGQVRALPNATAISGYRQLRSLEAMAALVLAGAPPRFSLLGHSMGARIALEIVRRAPERVERLALVSTGVHPRQPGEREKRHALRDIGRAHGMAALVDAWLPPMIAPARQSDAQLIQPLRDMCIAAGIATFEAQIEALLNRPEVEDLLPAIQCPALIAVGSEDVWSPPAQHAAIAKAITAAELHVIAGAGHMLPAEAPHALNHALLTWLS